MKRAPASALATLIAAAVIGTALTAADGDRYWPQWRGPNGTGVSKLAKPPTTWSETSHVRWKKEIPGRGAGTPVIWGDLVFISTAVPVGVSEAEAHAARGTAPGHAQVRRDGPEPQGRPRGLGARRARRRCRTKAATRNGARGRRPRSSPTART